MRQLPAFPHLRFRPTSRLADLGAKSPSIELLQKVRLTGPWVPLQMVADQSTWCNSRRSAVSYTHNARLFSMSSEPFGQDWHGTVVKFVTWNSSRINSVQQPRKCNLLNLREIS